MTITYYPQTIFKFLMNIIMGLTLMHVGTRLFLEFGVADNKWLDLFNMDHERTLPTFYSAVALLYAAGLLGLIAHLKSEIRDQYRIQWRILSVVFIFLALDEALVLHERLITHKISWTLPYAILLMVFGAYLLGFLISLPPATRWRFILAGAIFVIGAMGMEIPGGYVYARYKANFLYVVLVTIEEFMEMTGIAFFTYALALYINQEFPVLSFQLSADGLADEEIYVIKRQAI